MSNIIFNNVSFSYQKEEILKDISLKVNEGEIIGIKGENGSGKTTLLNLLLKLIKPTSGKIINTFKKQAYIPQLSLDSKDNIHATIYEILTLSYKNILPFTNKTQKQEIYEYLNKFDLYKYKDKQLNELSGGQQQKVRILKAILEKPQLLVLDEITSGIDTNFQLELHKILFDYYKQYNATIILVSHITSDFNNINKIFTLKDGGIING